MLFQKDLSKRLLAEFARNDLHLFVLLFTLFIILFLVNVVLLDSLDRSSEIL